MVDLPDPVGPPISTRPYGSRVSCPTREGRPRSDNSGGREGSARIAAAARPRSRCRLMRNRPCPGTRNEASAGAPSRYRCAVRSGSTARTASSISGPSSGPSGSELIAPSTRIDGGTPATSSRSLAPRAVTIVNHRSSLDGPPASPCQAFSAPASRSTLGAFLMTARRPTVSIFHSLDQEPYRSTRPCTARSLRHQPPMGNRAGGDCRRSSGRLRGERAGRHRQVVKPRLTALYW